MNSIFLPLFAILPFLTAPTELNSPASVATPAVAPIQTRSVRVDALSTVSFKLELPGGEYSRVIVRGDGDTDLDVFLFDEGGNLIDSDTDDTDFCIVGVTPRWSGEFTVVVQNLGRVYNRFQITLE